MAAPRECRIKLSSFWEEKKKHINEVANHTKGTEMSFLPFPVGDFTRENIEAGKTLFSLQFI